MRLSKTTYDKWFTIEISSEIMDDIGEDDEIPYGALEGLIIELELIAAELRVLLDEGSKEIKHAN